MADLALAESNEAPLYVPAIRSDTDRFTTEDLDPAKRQEIISMTKEGATLKEIAHHLSVSEHTVIAVRRQEKLDWRTCTIAALEEAVPLGAGRLREAFRTMDPEKIPIPWAIAVDKLLALKGEATSIIEVKHQVDFKSLQLPNEIQVLPADCDYKVTTDPHIDQIPEQTQGSELGK